MELAIEKNRTGLRILLSTFKKLKVQDGVMKLNKVSESIMVVLQNTGANVVFGSLPARDRF